MNKEMMKRIRTAAGYQKQAVRALFPGEMSGHLDAIEGELKTMLMETAMELVKEYRTGDNTESHTEEKTTKSKTRKVDIG